MLPAAVRTLALPALVSRDAARLTTQSLLPAGAEAPPDRLDEAIAWLCRTHDVTGRHGSSKGFSLLHGWFPAYPETTGYVIGTLLEYARRRGGRPDLVRRAREMGDWERTIQEPDGGIMQGQIGTTPRRSIVFNTGQVLHGWIDLEEDGHRGYDEAAARAARFLTDDMAADGTWDPALQYSGLAHTYDARVAWAMLRWARRSGDVGVRDAAHRQLELGVLAPARRRLV